MLKRALLFTFLCSFVFFSFVSPSYAGAVGKTLGEMGMDEETQNLGDAIQQEATALAGTLGRGKVDTVRGASGAMAELALNSGDLICNSWIIGFHIKIRNMVNENGQLEGEAQVRHLELLSKMQQFASKLEMECTRVGFMGPTGPTGIVNEAGEAVQPAPEPEPEKEWRVQPRVGETIADEICRRRCANEYAKMLQEERILTNTQSNKEWADGQVREKQTALRENQQRLDDAQKTLKETDKILKKGLRGNATEAQKDAYIRAGQQNSSARHEIEHFAPLVEEGQRALSRMQELARSVADTLERQLQTTEAARRAYYQCLKSCVEQAQKAGEATTLTCPNQYKCAAPSKGDPKRVPDKQSSTAPSQPTSVQKGACVVPKSPQSIMVGANGDVGSGAAMKDKIKGQAKGMAMGALNNVLGGSGMSLGGGGGGGSKGPKTKSDPTKGKFIASKSGGVELGVRAGTTKNGQILISSKILEGPGDGTFHAMWLEDGEGNVILPSEYLIFSLYRDWKLTVWWTHDRYVDGEHVLHEEGKEVTVGRDNMGDFAARYQGPEGAARSIWSQMGFNNASKGVQTLGAVFPVTVQDLAASTCPYYLQTHVTLPKEDPVRTVPFLYEIPALGGLFSDGEKAKKNLLITIQPALIQERVE